MPDLSSLLSRTFSAASFPHDLVLNLTITKVVAEEVGRDKEIKPVAYFKEDTRGLVLNKTNYGVLAEALGSTDTDRWVGTRVELSYNPEVQFGGKTVGGLRIKPLRNAPAPKK